MANSSPLPTTSGDDVPTYPMSEIGHELAKQLESRGHRCQFVVRAPGRVNLIGEHIDYNGYAVLPMALEQAIHLAVASHNDGDSLILTSTESEYESATIPVTDAVSFGSDGPPVPVKWFHYFLCGYHGIADYVKTKNLAWKPPNLVVHVGGAQYGGLWPAAGISSSSAFVVASAIAVMHASGLRIGRRELAGLCARCEQYIGMQGGGMDQASSLLGSQNHAILIEFTKPLVTVHPVPLPSDVVFVIAHSGVHARKAATSMYNERVSECRLAAKLLTKHSPNNPILDSTKPLCLADAQRAWAVVRPGEMVCPKGPSNESIVSKCLPVGVVTRLDLIQMGLSEEVIDFCLTPTTKKMNSFRLADRALHVYAEAERVLSFNELCQSQRSAGDTDCKNTLPERLAELMNASQRSCAELYECSCPELDQLTKKCKAAGALGSRLTGAGWGGCTVSLVPKALSKTFMERVCREYYEPLGITDAIGRLIFVSQPGPPAGLMPVD